MKISDKILFITTFTVFILSVTVIITAMLKIQPPPLVLPGIIAVACVVCVVLIIFSGIVLRYEELETSTPVRREY